MPDEQSSTQQWAKQIQDVLADSSKIREGLPDDIAIPFIEWGREIAEVLATRFAAPPSAEELGNTGYNLGRLMTRINWLVTYRTKKDVDWLTRTFEMVNKLSQDVYGKDAPTLSADEIAAWLADQPNHSDDALIHDLMARYTPQAMAAAAETGTAEPGQERPEASPSPLSDAIFGVPGGASVSPAPDQEKPEASSGPLSDAIFGAPGGASVSPAPDQEKPEANSGPLSDTVFGAPDESSAPPSGGKLSGVLSNLLRSKSKRPSGEDDHGKKEI